MAYNHPPGQAVGPIAWRCVQLLGGIVDFVGFGDSISADDVASARPATFLQVHMVNCGRGPAPVYRTIDRAHQYFCYGGYCGSYCHSLALCSSTLREEARR